ncbi:zf-HC2 domain-containing protein [Paenibacillus brasilensis]|uniref:Anti-sigma-W factor RsiW n=1 Tax=Paenibacillus brasilensis TaxID=128574 RepID=A0ABU0L6Z0_9BACL|nr:zf-HC2 domain-containing protein [Paenibacillus brasilensis]MDQ0497063.1 anti-sigma factor RsiW [Paenibacillus brasilensis]
MSDHIVDLISAYMDNELTKHERQQVEEHLYNCPECFAIFNDFMMLKNDVLQTFRSIEAPETVEETVLQAIRNPVPSNPSRERYWIFVPLLISLLIFVIVFTLVGSFTFKLASVGWKVFMNLMFAVGSLLASDPYLTAGLIGFSLMLMIGSGFSLTLLLKQNQFRRNQI